MKIWRCSVPALLQVTRVYGHTTIRPCMMSSTTPPPPAPSRWGCRGGSVKCVLALPAAVYASIPFGRISKLINRQCGRYERRAMRLYMGEKMPSRDISETIVLMCVPPPFVLRNFGSGIRPWGGVTLRAIYIQYSSTVLDHIGLLGG